MCNFKCNNTNPCSMCRNLWLPCNLKDSVLIEINRSDFLAPEELQGERDNCKGLRMRAELCPPQPPETCSEKTLSKSPQLQPILLLNFFPCTSQLWDMCSILCPGGWHQEFIDKISRKILHLPAWKKPFMQYLCFLPHRTSILLTKVSALATKEIN